MSLTFFIESAEHRFKQILEEFFISVYDEKSLSSHGIDHHRRVWSYVKELLIHQYYHDNTFNLSLTAKLIIASYLHDIGMSVETGTRHGKHSRDLCIQFLTKNCLPENDFQDVLTAVENHDRKDYNVNTGVNDLLNILSVADDLDAFGFIGIYRYSEIYLTRGISPEEIGHLIRDNAGKRFYNFIRTFGFTAELVNKHRKRYKILDSFFYEYNNQVSSYHFGGNNPSGYCGVVEVLTYMLQKQISLNDLCREREKYFQDTVILWFLKGLATELS